MCKIFICLLALTLVSCGGRIDRLAETARYALVNQPDVKLSPDEIDNYQYAAYYLHFEDSPRVLLALGYVQEPVRYWYSGAKESFGTRYGRIIKTSKLEANLVYTSNLSNDPLACIITSEDVCETVWQYYTDIELEHGIARHQLKAKFRKVGNESIILPNGNTILVEHWEESFSSKKYEGINHFWIAVESRRVIKSSQQLPPDLGRIEIMEVKPYTADLKNDNR